MKKYYYAKLGKEAFKKLFQRPANDFDKVLPIVKEVFAEVKKYGDQALKNYTKKFDKLDLETFKVGQAEIKAASEKVSKDLKKAFKVAAANIAKFHRIQIPQGICTSTMPGVQCSREYRPIEKVGLYIPGGTAPLPSTVLMLGIPAKLAGCKNIILCTPPKANSGILYAAGLVGITEIYQIGGAQAIAAMAYGTKSIPKVDKIFGPGNQYVTTAKMLIISEGLAIDLPAGPTEVLVIADKFANAGFVAGDLLSQAEHGADSQVILISDSPQKVDEIFIELKKQLEDLPRRAIAIKALENSFALITENLIQAMNFSNDYAPEHLILNVKNPDKFITKVQNAGSVFLGQYSCESAGDYASGTNHTLPTYGYAKNYSGICVESFLKTITFQKTTPEGIKNLGKTVEIMAQAEGLIGHKNAMSLRLESLK